MEKGFSQDKSDPRANWSNFCQFRRKRNCAWVWFYHYNFKTEQFWSKLPLLVHLITKVVEKLPFSFSSISDFQVFICKKTFSIFSARNFVQNFSSSNIFKLRISFLMIAISNWIYLRRDLFFLKIFLSSRRKLSSDIGHSNTRGAREPRMEVWSSWKKSNYTWT